MEHQFKVSSTFKGLGKPGIQHATTALHPGMEAANTYNGCVWQYIQLDLLSKVSSCIYGHIYISLLSS